MLPFRTKLVPGRVSAVAAFLAALVLAVAQLQAANSCEWNGIERVVAVGDVHGAYERYLEILRTTGIIDAGSHWSGGKTHFVQLGDVVDRGDDSRKVLDLLRRLEREAQAAGGYAHLLLGNHEVARMLGDLRLTTGGEYAAFAGTDSVSTREKYLKAIASPSGPSRDELISKTPLGLVEMRQAFGREGEYGRWLRQLPVVIKIDGLVFVHGGISPAIAPLGCAAINEQVRRELTSDLDKTRANPLASLVARADGPLWYRGLAQESEAFAPQLTEVLAKLGARALVIAHTVAESGRIQTRFDGRVIQIDTGMQPAYIAGGRASALEIQNGEAQAIYTDRHDPVMLPRVAGTTQEVGAAR
jgi:calcineurin-like phosphoesterase family protein